MAIDTRIQTALNKPAPLHELRSLIDSLIAAGQSTDTILSLFEETRGQLRNAGREADEDVVMEAMDFLVGWCSPHMKLVTDK